VKSKWGLTLVLFNGETAVGLKEGTGTSHGMTMNRFFRNLLEGSIGLQLGNSG